MAHTPPGSDSFGTRPSPGARLPRRAQGGSGVPQRSLRPAAQPVSNFIAPPAGGPEQSPLAGLASALSSLSADFTQSQVADDRKLMSEAELAAERELAKGDFEELDRQVKAGELPEYSSLYHRAAFLKIYGRELGERTAEDIISGYNTDFDKDNGDLDAFVSEKIKAALQGVDVPEVQDGFLDVAGKAADGVRRAHRDWTDTRDKSIKYQGVLNMMREVHKDTNGDPTAIAQFMRDFSTGESRRLLNLTTSETDNIILMFADEAADRGEEALAIALLKDTRDGVGSIAGKANEQGKQAKAILLKARNVRQTAEAVQQITDVADFMARARLGLVDEDRIIKYRRDNPKAITDAKVLSIIDTSRKAKVVGDRLGQGVKTALMGGFYRVSYLYDQGERDIIAARMFAQIRETTIKSGGSEEDVFQTQLRFGALNNFVNRQWKDMMIAAPKSANIAELAKSGAKLSDNLNGNIDLYNKMQSAAPKMVFLHTDGPAREFYKTVRLLEQMGETRRDAVAMYLHIEQNAATVGAALARERKYARLNSQVRKIANATDNAKLTDWFGTNPVNTEYIAQTLEAFAQVYIRAGVSVEKALEEAGQDIINTHTTVNGFLVPTRGFTVPDDIDAKVKMMVKTFVAANPDLYDEDDIDNLAARPISPDSPGVWIVIEMSGMVAPNAGATGTFALTSVQLAQNNAEANEVEAERQAVNVTISDTTAARKQLQLEISRNPSKIGRQGDRARASIAERKAANKALEAVREGRSVDVKTDPETGEIEVTRPGGTVGELNKNPGNIEATPESMKFFGVSKKQSGGRFLQFDTNMAGIRAIPRNLRTYQTNGFDTIESIINRWAPPKDGNDTEAYIRDLETRLGISRDEVLDLRGDDDLMLRIVKSIINHEIGSVPYPDSLVRKAINSAKRSL